MQSWRIQKAGGSDRDPPALHYGKIMTRGNEPDCTGISLRSSQTVRVHAGRPSISAAKIVWNQNLFRKQ